MNDVSDVVLGDLSLMGDGGIVIEGTGNASSHNIQVKNVRATIENSSEGAFTTISIEGTVHNVAFDGCVAQDCATYGFLNTGDSYHGWLDKISYDSCQAIGCGLSNRTNDWVVGFDLAENCKCERSHGGRLRGI